MAGIYRKRARMLTTLVDAAIDAQPEKRIRREFMVYIYIVDICRFTFLLFSKLMYFTNNKFPPFVCQEEIGVDFLPLPPPNAE